MSRDDLEHVGEPPDARFTLANERTLLAWNRTALALIAAGIAASQLIDFDSTLAHLAVAVPPIVIGAILAFASHHRWYENERRLRLGEPLSPATRLSLLTWALAAIAAIALVVVLADALG